MKDITFIIIESFIALSIVVLIGFYIYFRKKVKDTAELLQGAAWDLVRRMENNSKTGPRSRAAIRIQDHKNLVIETAKEVRTMPVVAGGNLIPSDAIVGGIDLVKYNETFTQNFWYQVYGIRTGLQIFLDLYYLHNSDAAYVKMVEHMKRQRDEFVTKGTKNTPNLPELKMILRLPLIWPTEDLPERYEKKKWRLFLSKDIKAAARRYRHLILDKLVYKPWPTGDEERVEYRGEKLLEAMREYIR